MMARKLKNCGLKLLLSSKGNRVIEDFRSQNSHRYSVITAPNCCSSEYQLDLLFACPLGKLVYKCLKFGRSHGTTSLLGNV